MQFLAVYFEKNSPKHSFFFFFFLPFPVIWWFVHVSGPSQLEGFFVCQQQVLSVFIGNATILLYERFHLCRTHRYLGRCARAVYILHIMLYMHAYLMYIPIDVISWWDSLHKTQKLMCRMHSFFLKQMPQLNCAVIPNGIDQWRQDIVLSW